MSAGTQRVAAIDIGTVTTRLLIADVSAEGIREVARSTDITHLGEGLAASGELSARAIERVRTAIAGYAATMAELGVHRIEAVATSASRDASNAHEFIGALAPYGVKPQVIEGSREAYLSFLGATSQMDIERVLLDDIGGGSTELVYGSATGPATDRRVEISMARSFDIGSRRLTEAYLRSDPPTITELGAARSHAVEMLRPYFDALGERPAALVSVAGTATTVVSVLREMEPYDPAAVHGSIVTGADVSDVLETLAALPLEARARVVGLHPGRAGVIVAGILVLETVMALSGTDSTIVSEHDILYGILLDACSGESS